MYKKICKILLIIIIFISIFKIHIINVNKIYSKTKINYLLNSENLQWIKTGGPIGGMGYDIRIHPFDNNILYVTDVWSGVHKSIDGGKTWVQKNNGIKVRTGPSGDAIPVFSLTINQKNPNLMWCGLQGFKAIYKSTDGGETWIEKSNGIPDLPGITFRSFTFDPYNPDIVYAGCEVGNWDFDPKIFNLRKSFSTGKIFKTIDGGENWKEILDCGALVRWIFINPRNTNIIYAATGIFDRGFKKEEGILKSIDGGKTWFNINNGIDDSLTIHGLDMDINNPDILYCATGLFPGMSDNPIGINGSVYKTEDGGKNWKKILTGGQYNYNPPGGFTPFQLVNVSPSNSNIIYVAAYNGTQDIGHFFRSEDGGKTWRHFRLGPPGIYSGTPISMLIHPKNPYIVYINSYNGGNFKTENGGETWEIVSKGYTGAQSRWIVSHPVFPNIVYIASRSDVSISYNFGSQYIGLEYDALQNLQDVQSIAINPLKNNEILVTDRHIGKIFKSLNKGKNWNLILEYFGFKGWRCSYPNNVLGFSNIIISNNSPNVIYAGSGRPDINEGMLDYETKSFGVFKSTDYGNTWYQCKNKGLENTRLYIQSLVIHPSNSNFIYIATYDGGVYYSKDGGDNFINCSSGIPVKNITSLAIHPIYPNILFAGTNTSGIYKTIDSGNTWFPSKKGMDQEASIRSIAIDPIDPNIIYAADWRTGVYISYDCGNSWKLINNGLTTRAVNYLAVSNDGSVLYAATEGEGVFVLPLRKTKDIYFSAETENHKINLYWSPFPGEKYKKYKIYKMENNQKNLLIELEGTVNNYVDENVENYNIYQYQIIGIDENGREYLSDIIKVEPQYNGANIDGLRDKYEWPDIPIYKDPSNDNEFFNIDIKNVYGFTFNEYLYLMIDFYKFDNNGIFDIQIDINYDNYSDYHGGFPFISSGQYSTGWWDETKNPRELISAVGCYIIKNDIIEAKIPLSWIENKTNFNLFIEFIFGDDKTGWKVIDKTPWLNIKPLEITPWHLIYPKPPKNILLTQSSANSILIKWLPSEKGTYDIKGYYIYKETSIDGEFLYPINFVPITICEYEDRNIENGKTYYYKIRAEDIDGNMSDFSEAAEICVKYLEIEDKKSPEIIVNLPDKVYTEILNINGKVKDDISGVKYLKINNSLVEILINGYFTYLLNLKIGENEINFECGDNKGNITKISYKIIYIKRIKIILQINNKIIYIDDKPVEIDTPPLLIEGRTYLPIRYIAEPIGAKVLWDGSEKKVTIILKSNIIELWIGKNIAKVNGYNTYIDVNNSKVAPMIINGRTMLPIRFVAENLGCYVEWDGKDNKITIIYSEGG